MKQEKICLYLSRYNASENELDTLNEFGINDIITINVSEKGSMKRIFSYEPDDAIIVYGYNFNNDILRVLREEEYKTVAYERIHGLLESTNQVYKMFEKDDEEDKEDQFI